jgi:hypothetical protein
MAGSKQGGDGHRVKSKQNPVRGREQQEGSRDEGAVPRACWGQAAPVSLKEH